MAYKPTKTTVLLFSSDLSLLKKKIKAYHTLFDDPPKILVCGTLIDKKGDMIFASSMEVLSIGKKRFNILMDDQTTESVHPFRPGEVGEGFYFVLTF